MANLTIPQFLEACLKLDPTARRIDPIKSDLKPWVRWWSDEEIAAALAAPPGIERK